MTITNFMTQQWDFSAYYSLNRNLTSTILLQENILQKAVVSLFRFPLPLGAGGGGIGG